MIVAIFLTFISLLTSCQETEYPWDNGKLTVSPDGRYLMHENGTPFFWMADTGWLLPERTDRDDALYYLDRCSSEGYNVVLVQTINDVPAVNVYGEKSMINGFEFSGIDREGIYGYWDHMDFIVSSAAERGLYVGMVCIWGGLVKQGKMTESEAGQYGRFLAERYADCPNIIWIIGGDVRGDVKTEVWEALATTIKDHDHEHLMTFHPFGRTLSSWWFNDADWLDFNMFQSGHRRYGQRRGDLNYTIEDGTEEDNWRYVEKSFALEPVKPVLDGEPSYEDIPQGLHDPSEPRWKDHDVRRYAYWSVFAGACGHTYGHNSIMQFYSPGYEPAYSAEKTWKEALDDPGYSQMKHLKKLMLAFPYFERVPDQSVLIGENGERYDRVAATRGRSYMLIYNYTGREMKIDLDKISGSYKHIWKFCPRTGSLDYVERVRSGEYICAENRRGAAESDYVLIAADSGMKWNIQ